MKKFKLTPAILIISLMIFPANASVFWLDIAKEKPLGEQIIKESKKGVIALVRNVLKKK